jgi:hypothetical protein
MDAASDMPEGKSVEDSVVRISNSDAARTGARLGVVRPIHAKIKGVD